MTDLIEERAPEKEETRSNDVDLEAIWTAPYPAPARPQPARAASDTTGPWWLGRAITIGWVVFLGSVFFAPAPQPGQVTPVWADFLIAGMFFGLGTAGILGMTKGGRAAYGAAFCAGILGMGLAVGCMSTAHHPGGWWAWELVATSALTVLAAAGLRRSRRRA